MPEEKINCFDAHLNCVHEHAKIKTEILQNQSLHFHRQPKREQNQCIGCTRACIRPGNPRTTHGHCRLSHRDRSSAQCDAPLPRYQVVPQAQTVVEKRTATLEMEKARELGLVLDHWMLCTCIARDPLRTMTTWCFCSVCGSLNTSHQ